MDNTMKRVLLAVCISIATLLPALQVSAQISMEDVQVSDNRYVTVNILTTPSARVAIKAQKENDTLIGAILEQYADEKGNVQFYFKMPEYAPNGKYILSYCEDENNAQQYPFEFADITGFLKDLNEASTAQAAFDLLSPTAQNHYTATVMGFEMDLYDELTNGEQLQMLEQYLKTRKGNTQTDNVDAFSKALAVQLADKDKLKALTLFNPEFEEIKFNDLSNQEQRKWITDTMYIKEKTTDGFEKAYTQASVLYRISNAKNTELTQIIKNYGDVLGITNSSKYTRYQNMSGDNKGKVHNKIIETFGNTRTITEFVNIFEDAVDAIVTTQSNGGGSGGGGGGGNSSNKGSSLPPKAGSVFTGLENESSQTDNDEDKPLFNDLSGFEWAETAILNLAEKGVIAGYGDGLFAPSKFVNREEFIKMAVLAANVFNPDAECEFEDVDKNQWYYRYIASGVEQGIINGVRNDQFGTGYNITRQDMAVIVYRLAEKKWIDISEKRDYIGFDDENLIAEYAKESVSKMYSANIINGVGDNLFAPTENATRAQAAKVLYDIFYNKEVVN